MPKGRKKSENFFSSKGIILDQIHLDHIVAEKDKIFIKIFISIFINIFIKIFIRLGPCRLGAVLGPSWAAPRTLKIAQIVEVPVDN